MDGLESFFGPLFLVSFDMVREEFFIAWICHTIEINLDPRFTYFNAEVYDLNAPTALDWRTTWHTDCKSRNWQPPVTMLNAVRLDRSIGSSWQKPSTRDTHWCIACLKFSEANNLITEFYLKTHDPLMEA